MRKIVMFAMLLTLAGMLAVGCSKDKGAGPTPAGITGAWPKEVAGQYKVTHFWWNCSGTGGCQWTVVGYDTVDICSSGLEFKVTAAPGTTITMNPWHGQESSSLIDVTGEGTVSTRGCSNGAIKVYYTTAETQKPPRRDGWEIDVTITVTCNGQPTTTKSRYVYARLGDSAPGSCDGSPKLVPFPDDWQINLP